MEISIPKYDENDKVHRLIRSLIFIVISFTMFLCGWWFIAEYSGLIAIASPMETWEALVDLYRNGDPATGVSMGEYIGSSFKTFFKGFLCALAVAIPIGLIMGYFKVIRDLLTPIIEVLRPIAPIAWAPIFISMPVLGYDYGPMMVVFVGIFFPLLTNVIFGVQKIDTKLIDASKTLGASQIQIFFKVLVPSAIPYVMNGIKVGLGIGWMCIVAAELYATPLGGIGFYLQEQVSFGYWPGAYAAMVIIAVLGLMTTGVASYIHTLLIKRMGME